MQPCDISAVLLTIGENTFTRCYESLKNQTATLQDLIVIRDVRPFSRAFNEGVTAVKTPLFLQCDADMILEKNCVEQLLQEMKPQTGMVVGFLKDPLQGRIQGVKLYRTEFCKEFPMIDSFNCEEIFRQNLLKRGIEVTVLDPKSEPVGAHEPDLTDAVYQFERFKYLGVKIYARRAWYDFAYRLIQLARSEHQAIATMAVFAMISGIFTHREKDHLKGYAESAEYRLFLNRFIKQEQNDAPRIYDAAAIYNFLFGYQDAILFLRRQKRFSLDSLARDILLSSRVQQWAFLLGFCSAFMNLRESIAQNRIARFRRMKPFLLYLNRHLRRVHESMLS